MLRQNCQDWDIQHNLALQQIHSFSCANTKNHWYLQIRINSWYLCKKKKIYKFCIETCVSQEDGIMKTFASYGMYKIHQDRYWYVMLRTRIFVPDNGQYFYSLHYRTLVAEIKTENQTSASYKWTRTSFILYSMSRHHKCIANLQPCIAYKATTKISY